MATNKPTLIVYANCQGGWLVDKLRGVPGMDKKYRIIYIPSWDDPVVRDRVLEPDVFTNCSLLLHQVAGFIPELPFTDLLPSTCRRFKFPVLWMNLFWPLYAIDPRNEPLPDFPFGKYVYGDRLVIELLNKGLSPEQVFQSYMETDLKKMLDLERWYELCMDGLHAVDDNSDMQIFDYIEQYLTTRRLFITLNHPTDYLLDLIVRKVIEFDSSSAADAMNLYPSTGVGMGNIEIPIHPTLIDYYGVKWASKDMKYRYMDQYFTFEEYLRHYIVFDTPVSTPPANPDKRGVGLASTIKRLLGKKSQTD